MASSDDDEDLKLALALSLQQSPARTSSQPSASQEAVDLTSDTEDEDEDMRRAIALSLRQVGQSPKRTSAGGLSVPSPSSSGQTAATGVLSQSALHTTSSTEQKSSSGIFGFDRKAMEQERLARLGKRKRDTSPDQPSKQLTSTQNAQDKPTHSMKAQPLRNNSLQYPTGAIKRTFATKYPRTDDITIDEVLQADSVRTAVISSFMWDSEWLNKKLNPLKVKQIWIMNAKDKDVQQRYVREMEENTIPNLLLHFPPMDGMIHSMHSKFMLLFGKEKLRIVVPTANMTPIDWGEVKNSWQPGVMENSVFLIDLPRRQDDSIGETDDLTLFGKEFVYFLEKQQVNKKVIQGLLKFDFSQTDHLAFVHAIGGTHKGEAMHPTGLPSLSKAIQDLHLDDVRAIELDYASASLGAINDTLLQRLYLAARGEAFTTASTTPKVREHFRIYFPMDESVRNSVGGPDCGGIISLTRQYYTAPTFPRDCMRNYDSTRRGMLSHNKLLFARGIKKNGEAFAWVYVGSANLSESAWGGQKVLKSGQMGSLNIRNWECGVVMPVPDDKRADMKLEAGEIPPMDVFAGTVEVPFVHPGQRYGDKQPWFFRAG